MAVGITLDAMLTRDNGYPLDFKINSILEDSTSGRYFPATLAHHIVIRNWKDVELERHLQTYRDALYSKQWRPSSMMELIIALRRISEDEQIRRAKFIAGEIKLEDYKPLVYTGNTPRIVAAM
jgi:hypothetical protein